MNKRIVHYSILWGIAILLVVASNATVAQAASLCVRPGGAGGCYSSIQAAVDAATDGDQIIIRKGKYVEQVTIIDKDLTLIGRDGAIVQAPDGMEQTLLGDFGYEFRPIIGVGASEITIRNLTVDGVNSSAANDLLEGITLIDSGGLIQDSIIRNIGFGTPTLPIVDGEPIYQGDGIVVINFDPAPRTVTIEENRILNFNNNGMTLLSFPDPAGPANLTVHVVENTLVGMGPNDVVDGFGILLFTEVDESALPESYVTGTILHNHVRDVVTVPPLDAPAFGIIAGQTFNLRIAGNEVENVNIGINAPWSFYTQIVENQISGPRPDISGLRGLILSGSDIQVLENRFKKFDVGIFLQVEHPGVGSALNTVLNDNRFENVAAEVTTGPGAPAAEAARVAPVSSKLQRYGLPLQP